MTAEGEIRRVRDSYVQGLIDVEELEARVWDVLTGVWSPTSAMASVLREAWTEPRFLVPRSPEHPASLALAGIRFRKRHDWDDGYGAIHSVPLSVHEANLRQRAK
jgi:hypothetical protein